MKTKNTNSSALSEIVSIILIIALVLVLAMVVYALFFGNISGYLKHTYRVAATAGTTNVPLGTSYSTPIMYAMPSAGEKYYLSGQSDIPAGSVVASFILDDPNGNMYTVKTLNYSASANQFGTRLFIYQDQNYNLWVTDSQQKVLAAAAQIRPFAKGVWTITMIDNTANVPLTQMTVNIGSNGGSGSINPLAGTTTWANGSWDLVNSSGYEINFTNNGVTPMMGPGGTSAFYFNGLSDILGQNNPGLAFTGNMALSLWIDPTTATGTVSPYNPSNWATLVGKGSIDTSTGIENDDYQLVQMGNQIYFEWGDTSTTPPSHYNIVTTGATALKNENWNYVAVSTTASGAPEIYINGVAQPYTLSNTNSPLYGEVGSCSDPPVCNTLFSSDTSFTGVHLNNVNNGITIGSQNSNTPADNFNYTGGMSAITFYNQALSQSAVTSNLNNYLT